MRNTARRHWREQQSLQPAFHRVHSETLIARPIVFDSHTHAERMRVNSLRLLGGSAMLVAVSAANQPLPGQASLDSPNGGRAPLALGEAIRQAISQHPLIEAARARVSAARGMRASAGALPNPVFTYSVENVAFPGRTPLNGIDRETQAFATLPLEPLFQRWARIRGSSANLSAASADLVRARQLVALDAAQAFFRVAAAQVAVDASEDVRARLADLVAFNRARVAEGVVAEADLIRTQVELDRVGTEVTLNRVELVRARAALAAYLGLGSSRDGAGGSAVDSLRVTADPAAVGDSALRPLAELIGEARSRRPDVIAARARVAALRSDVTVQRALVVRQVGATLGSKRTAGITSMIVGISLPVPLFDQNRGEIERAEGERLAAEQELAWTERIAAAEVGAAYQAVRLLGAENSRLGSAAIARAEESVRIAVAAYQEGAVSLLQLLDATRTLADSRIAYRRVQFSRQESLLELDAAAGGDWLTSLAARSDDTTGDRK